MAVAGVLTTSAVLAPPVAALGAQIGNSSNMPSVGSTDPISNPRCLNDMSGTDRSSNKMMRKGSKLKAASAGTVESKPKR
ncbi:MAG: hypothetical protein EOO36_01760 [Cytophagaceae bacterium]|nr:MAG: hypothetical protein EOO36_01760 [Cytophagaceae bacterium]